MEQKIKVIFLDIDGVMNVIPQGRDDFGPIFHDHFVDNLKRIIEETDAKIVISSSWRLDGLNTMKKMWEYRNLPGEIIDITPISPIAFNPHFSPERGEEIQMWLDCYNNISTYVILDDDIDMLESQLYNFVQCSGNIDHIDCIDVGYGLTNICSDKAISILNI